MEVLDNAIHIMGGTTVASRTGDDVLESSDGALYVIGGIEFTAAANEREDIWMSADKGRR